MPLNPTMPQAELGYPAIVDVAAALPEAIISNEQLIRQTGIDSSPSWIEAHTRIKNRHVAEVGEYASTLAIRASERVLQSSGTDVEDLFGIYLATITPDFISPSTATLVHAALDAPENCSAVDLNAACAGSLMAIEAASNKLQITRSSQSALIIGAETLTRITNFKDRATAVLFGDGAGAALVRNHPEASAPFFASRTETDFEAMHIPAGGLVEPSYRINDPRRKLYMDGPAVKKHGINIMVGASIDVAKQAGIYDPTEGIDWGEIDYVVPHQGSGAILDAVGEALKIPEDKCIITIDEHGNTSAASILMTIARGRERGDIKPGNHRVLLPAIGVGFVGGAALMNMILE
jgi:3-oxoacyl-[acyl-carrier-protein] synthase-3